jgi:PST family polysaccharide transporter
MTEAKASYHRILRSTSIIGGASFINIAIGVLRTKVLAVLLGPAGVGLASLYAGLMGTASTVATMGLGPVGTRQIAEACSKDDARAIMVARRALFWATMLLACAGGLVVWSLRSILAVYALGSASYSGAVGFLSIGVALSVAGASQAALIQGMRRIGDIARLNVFGSAISTALGIGLLWRWGKAGLVAYVLIAPLASFVLGHVYVSRLPKAGTETVFLQELTHEWKMLLRLGIAMVGAGLAQQLAQLWIRIDVAKVLGAQSLGQYQAAWTISLQYVSFVLMAMGTDYYPRLTGVIHDHKAARNLVNEQTEIATLLSAPVFIAMMAVAPWVIHLLYAASFTPAIEILRWQVLGDVLKVASWPLGFLILAAGDGKTFFLTESAAWLVTTGLIMGLVRVVGLPITGIAYLAMYAFYLPLVYLLARRRIGFYWSRSVLYLSGLSLAICMGTGILTAWTRWGMLDGCLAATAFAIFSLGRITHMSNLGGPVGRLGALVRLLTKGSIKMCNHTVGPSGLNPEPLVSVLVLSYNHEKFVVECLDSIKNLNYKRLELIVSDDCSQDKTFSLAEQWGQRNASRFERTLVVRQEKNLGIVRNLQYLFNSAQGDYIVYLGSDDMLIESAITGRVKVLQENRSIDAVFGNAQFVSTTGSVLKEEFIPRRIGLELSSSRLLLPSLLVSFLCPGPALMLRKEAVHENGSLGILPHDLKVEDRYIYIRLASRGKLRYVNEVVAKWRFVPGSMSRPSSNIHDIDLFAQGDRKNRHLLSGINRLLIENQIAMYNLEQKKGDIALYGVRQLFSQIIVKLSRITLRICATAFRD